MHNEPVSPPITLSIVVPVYKSQDCLKTLIDETISALSATDLAHSYEIILVNDDSPDGSWKEIKRIAAERPQVRGVSLLRNFGQHNATMAGLKDSRGRYVVIMDDDLQHPPAAIPKIVQQLRDGADVCYTIYRHRKHAAWKKLGSWINNAAATVLLGKPHALYLSSYKGLSRVVVDAVTRYDGPFTYIDGLILDVTRNINVLAVDHQDRLKGEGNYNLVRSISLWLKMATSFSVLPLRVASIAGMLLGIVAAGMAVYVVIRVLILGTPYPGWASVIVTVLLVGSMQLLGIGLVGEYIGRAYLRMNNKPQFIVRERTSDDLAPRDAWISAEPSAAQQAEPVRGVDS
jgi:polyisoprenyl-phosphate glycosyltransferase